MELFSIKCPEHISFPESLTLSYIPDKEHLKMNYTYGTTVLISIK